MNLQTIKALLLKFVNDEEGLTIMEYAMGGVITVAVAATFVLLGGTKIAALCTAVNGGNAC